MRKIHKIKTTDIEKDIMAKVSKNQIVMKPRWYFVLGSLLLGLGLTSLSVGAIFMTNLTMFLLRKHGPMAQWRLQTILSSFPLWIPVLAILGVILGLWLLKKYDFSYRKNFWYVIAGFILSIVLAASAMDFLGLNDIWSRQGPMKRFYQQIERQDQFRPNRSVQINRGRKNSF